MIKFKNIFAVCGAVAISSISSFSAFADEQLTKEKALDLLFRAKISNIDSKEACDYWQIKDNKRGVADSPLAAYIYSRYNEFFNNYNIESKSDLDLNKIDTDFCDWDEWQDGKGFSFELNDNGNLIGEYDLDYTYYHFEEIKDGWNLVSNETGEIYNTYPKLEQYAGVFDFSEYLEDNSDEDDNNFSEENNIQAEKESPNNQATAKTPDSLATSIDSNSDIINSQVDNGSPKASQPSVNADSVNDNSPKAVVAVGDDNQTVATPKSKSATSSTIATQPTAKAPTTINAKNSNYGAIGVTVVLLVAIAVGGFFAYKKSKK